MGAGRVLVTRWQCHEVIQLGYLCAFPHNLLFLFGLAWSSVSSAKAIVPLAFSYLRLIEL